MFHLWWVSADKQSDIDGGEFETEAQAEAAIPAWADQMIEQCAGEEDQQQTIRAGSFVVVEENSKPGEFCSRWKWSDLDTLRQSDVVAKWDDKDQVYRAGQWQSDDGDNWTNEQDGTPVDSPEFRTCTITFDGGPRDGEEIG